MFDLTKKVLKDCTTVSNGNDFDLMRIGQLAGVVVIVGGAIYGLWKVEHSTEIGQILKDFAFSLGGLHAASGVGLLAKDKTEPE